jgi:hypothetical protein
MRVAQNIELVYGEALVGDDDLAAGNQLAGPARLSIAAATWR